MDLVIFEENKPFVLEAFRNGDFDYMEAASVHDILWRHVLNLLDYSLSLTCMMLSSFAGILLGIPQKIKLFDYPAA